jgi:hypothetical protein
MIHRFTIVLLVLGFAVATANAAEVTGSVVYANGHPCANAEITLQGPTQTHPVLSGSDGRFLIARVRAGEYTLSVKTPRGLAQYRVQVAEPSVNVAGLQAR